MGIIAAIISFLGSIISWFTGKKEAAGVAQGRAEQQNADMKEGEAVIHRANVAAKKVEQEEGADPNDLDKCGIR